MKNLSQGEFAEMIRKSRTLISRIENGEKGISVDTLIEIANALEVSTDDILVDSLMHHKSQTDTDLHYLMLDCTKEEARFLVKNAKALKALLREFGI